MALFLTSLVEVLAQRKWEMGVHLSPFAVATEDLRGKSIMVDSMHLSITNGLRSNPSLQIGLFLHYQYTQRWSIRAEASIMDRAVMYAVVNPMRGRVLDKWTSGAIAATVNTALNLHFQMSRGFSVGFGFAGQFHFPDDATIDYHRPADRDFAMLLNQTHKAIKPVTTHAQLSFLWRHKRWNISGSLQRSLSSITTQVVHRNQVYPLPPLHTEIYFVNIGYVLLPSRNKKK